MRLTALPVLALPTALLLTVAQTAAASEFPVTVQSCNREVTFTAPPQRAVSNDVNLTEMMLVLGLRDRMVGYTGVTEWKTLDEVLRADIEELPELSPAYPTKEVLLGADADFYFAGWNYGMNVGGEVTPETLARLTSRSMNWPRAASKSCPRRNPRWRISIPICAIWAGSSAWVSGPRR